MTIIVKMDVGKKIKVLRAKRGVTQQGLANLINKTRSLISFVETTSKVNYYTLSEIADALDVNMSYFENEQPVENVLKESKGEYNSLYEQIKKLERENELLNEIISNQKEIITQLKEKFKS